MEVLHCGNWDFRPFFATTARIGCLLHVCPSPLQPLLVVHSPVQKYDWSPSAYHFATSCLKPGQRQQLTITLNVTDTQNIHSLTTL